MIDALLDIEDIVDSHQGLARLVLDYILEMKRIVDSAKAPGFDASSWGPLARLVAVDDFERVGPFKDVMNWDDYVGFLTGWAPNRHWECSFRRITEAGNLVFLELEERSEPGNSAAGANSLSVYEFDDATRLRRLDVYLQMPPVGRPT